MTANPPEPARLYDDDMERALIGAALIDPVHFALAVQPSDFWLTKCGAIWEAGQDLARGGTWVDLILLAEKLAHGGEPVTLGDLLQLATQDGMDSTNAPEYAARVVDLARRRAVESYLQRAVNVLHHSDGTWQGELTALAAQLQAAATPQPQAARVSWAELDTVLGPIVWEWPSWLAAGFLTLLTGDSGAGKSALALRLSACYLRGDAWPDGTPFTGQQGCVLWCEAEGAQALNLERARNWHLPLERILTPLAEPLDAVNLRNGQHLAAIGAAARLQTVRLIVVDSLSGATDAQENDADKALPPLRWLAELARDTGKPVLVLHHLRKKGAQDGGGPVTMDRVRGSSAIVQLARMVLAVDTPDSETPDARRVAVIKSNIGKFPAPLGMTIDETGVAFGSAPEPARILAVADKAARFLDDLYHARGVRALPATEVQAAAQRAGHSEYALGAAKERAGIAARRDGKGWLWCLPEPSEN